MRGYRTLNPWGHVSKADRAARQNIAAEIVSRAKHETWYVFWRPVGPDDQPVRTIGMRCKEFEWKAAIRYGFASREEALEHMFRIAPFAELQADGIYRKYEMRYRVADIEAE